MRYSVSLFVGRLAWRCLPSSCSPGASSLPGKLRLVPGCRKWTDHPKSALTAMAIAVAAFVTLHIGIVDPIHYGLERTRPFVSQVEALYETAHACVLPGWS